MSDEIKTLEKIIINTTIYIKKYLLNNIITQNLYNISIEKLENIYFFVFTQFSFSAFLFFGAFLRSVFSERFIGAFLRRVGGMRRQLLN